MLKADRDFSRAEMGVGDNEILVLSMGGSLGAATINTAVTKLIAAHHKDENLRFLHAMGQYGLWVPEKLKEMGISVSDVSITKLQGKHSKDYKFVLEVPINANEDAIMDMFDYECSLKGGN